MLRNVTVWLRVAASLGAVAVGMAQTAPPDVSIQSVEVRRYTGDPESIWAGNCTAFTASDPVRSFDVLCVTVLITDPDWLANPGDQDNEPALVRFIAGWDALGDYPPAGPPVPQASFAPFLSVAPPPGFAGILFTDLIIIPQFEWRNQARYRGLVDFDVRYVLRYEATNDGTVFGSPGITTVSCVANPLIPPSNPQAFADAGGDITVEAGNTVTLDGSETFDAYNVGFDVTSPNVFEKDLITYTWEWVSGPEVVAPTYPDVTNRPAIGQVTLNQIGTYVYRLVVDDGKAGSPTTDTVTIRVVSVIPPNRPPVAVVSAPAGAVPAGALISLDGTGSFDPDGDPLSFRWEQTDEVGGALPRDRIGEFFQPLNGVESTVVSWQATQPGTYHFRLVVNDGEFLSAARTSVNVVQSQTAGISISYVSKADLKSAGAADDAADPPPTTSPPPAGCGLGSALPLLAVPTALAALRRRR